MFGFYSSSFFNVHRLDVLHMYRRDVKFHSQHMQIAPRRDTRVKVSHSDARFDCHESQGTRKLSAGRHIFLDASVDLRPIAW